MKPSKYVLKLVCGFKGSFELVSLILLTLLAGCSTTATLYPLEGPYSKIVPLPVITAQVTGIWGNTGKVFLTLPDGESAEGKWSSAAGSAASVGFGTLYSTYGAVYGTAISVSDSGGVNRGQAVVVGERGTVIEVEFYTGSGTANGFGFAKDNNGNVYRLLF